MHGLGHTLFNIVTMVQSLSRIETCVRLGAELIHCVKKYVWLLESTRGMTGTCMTNIYIPPLPMELLMDCEAFMLEACM